jgi:glycoprotein 3-alpha-L-fucosyltransferase
MKQTLSTKHRVLLKKKSFSVLGKFRPLNHVPVWKDERPPSIRVEDDLKVYIIYPVGLTQCQHCTVSDLEMIQNSSNIKDHACAKFQVNFV